MLETRNNMRPDTAIGIVEMKKKRIMELKKQRIDFMKKTKDSHPQYQKLTDKEFHDRKVEFARWTQAEIKKIESEIKEIKQKFLYK